MIDWINCNNQEPPEAVKVLVCGPGWWSTGIRSRNGFWNPNGDGEVTNATHWARVELPETKGEK